MSVDMMVTSPNSSGSNGSYFPDYDTGCAAGDNAPLNMVMASSSQPSATHAIPSLSHVKQDENGNSPLADSGNLVKQGIDPEAYCQLCKKEFCSKYFLRTHRANIHGIVDHDNMTMGSVSEHQLLPSLPLAPHLAPSAVPLNSSGAVLQHQALSAPPTGNGSAGAVGLSCLKSNSIPLPPMPRTTSSGEYESLELRLPRSILCFLPLHWKSVSRPICPKCTGDLGNRRSACMCTCAWRTSLPFN